MTDRSRIIPHQGAQLPAVQNRSLPSLPTSAGGFALSAKSRATKDAAFSRANADMIRAQADAYRAAAELSNARFDFGVVLSRWQTFESVCAHETAKGHMTRLSELKILALECETKEITARTARDAAMLALQAYQPQPAELLAPAAPAAPPQPKGLAPADVRSVLQMDPRMKPEDIDMIVLMLDGLVAEKNK